MIQESFTVLIGSFARGEGGPDSDVDILRVGHCRSVARPPDVGINVPISYIDYDYSTFMDLHRKGSLFLYHSFREGRLIEGDINRWARLRSDFRVTYNHRDSINEYCELLKFIDAYPGFELAFMPYLSNTFKALKNIGIFKLAEIGCFVFDKTTALVKGCGLSLSQAEILIACNNCFERSRIPCPSETSQYQEFAQKWKLENKQIIEGIIYDQ
jgi:predicted nucleotidyltransferase